MTFFRLQVAACEAMSVLIEKWHAFWQIQSIKKSILSYALSGRAWADYEVYSHYYKPVYPQTEKWLKKHNFDYDIAKYWLHIRW